LLLRLGAAAATVNDALLYYLGTSS
jgi:hypothetical protein